MLQKVEGIVIRTTDYGETNKIITIYTRELGKVGVLARGARKVKSRLSSVSQLFTYGLYLVQIGSGLGTLQQGELLSSMRGLRENIDQTAHAAYIAEITDKFTEEKKVNPYIFELLFQTFTNINEGKDLDVITFIFELKMLDVSGIAPFLNGCVLCKSQEGSFSFSIKEGGLLCHRCQRHDPYHLQISWKTVKLLRVLYLFDLSRLGNISVKEETKREIRKLLNEYYDEYSGVYLKTRRFIEQLALMKEDK